MLLDCEGTTTPLVRVFLLLAVGWSGFILGFNSRSMFARAACA